MLLVNFASLLNLIAFLQACPVGPPDRFAPSGFMLSCLGRFASSTFLICILSLSLSVPLLICGVNILRLWPFFYSIFFLSFFGVGLPAYLSNHNPFSREHTLHSKWLRSIWFCACILLATLTHISHLQFIIFWINVSIDPFFFWCCVI